MVIVDLYFSLLLKCCRDLITELGGLFMLYAVMCVRNEEYHLQSFLNHLRKYVDGFIDLDDGSSDKTLDILKNEPKMIK